MPKISGFWRRQSLTALVKEIMSSPFLLWDWKSHLTRGFGSSVTATSCPLGSKPQDGIRCVRYLLGETSVKEKWNRCWKSWRKLWKHSLSAGLIPLWDRQADGRLSNCHIFLSDFDQANQQSSSQSSVPAKASPVSQKWTCVGIPLSLSHWLGIVHVSECNADSERQLLGLSVNYAHTQESWPAHFHGCHRYFVQVPSLYSAVPVTSCHPPAGFLSGTAEGESRKFYSFQMLLVPSKMEAQGGLSLWLEADLFRHNHNATSLSDNFSWSSPTRKARVASGSFCVQSK